MPDPCRRARLGEAAKPTTDQMAAEALTCGARLRHNVTAGTAGQRRRTGRPSMRRLAWAVACLLAAAAPARADYPDRPVRVVVPVAAGGGIDVMARMLSQKLSERLGQQFVVENRAGAAGVIGTKAVIAAPADG